MSIVHSWEETQTAKRVSGGGPERRSRRHSRSATTADTPARAGGTEPVGGVTPWVSSMRETNSRNTTGSPSVTK